MFPQTIYTNISYSYSHILVGNLASVKKLRYRVVSPAILASFCLLVKSSAVHIQFSLSFCDIHHGLLRTVIATNGYSKNFKNNLFVIFVEQ